MKHNDRMILTLSISLWLLCSASLTAQAAGLRMIFVAAESAAEVKKLHAMGLDIATIRPLEHATSTDQIDSTHYRVEIVASSSDEQRLSKHGFEWQAAPQPRTAAPQRRAVAAATETVYHDFDTADIGMRARIERVAAEYPAIAQLQRFGQSIQGRPLYALKLGKERAGRRKPEVLIVSTHHAREWVAAQMGIRLLEYLVHNYDQDGRVTDLLNRVDVWLVPIGNPDGYQYTFTNERLWRKNLRDNNNDGQITNIDGVDLNRNFGGRWGYDNEGSSGDLSSATYRGTAPFSEPENEAMRRFIKDHDFKFAISYHTYGNLILYPLGWQVKTPSHDDPIFVAQAGTDDNPAIWDTILDQGYDPGVGADLYITNGDFTDWLYGDLRIPSYTVELTNGVDSEGNFYGFQFPDDETLVQTVFEDNLEFALSVAESAIDPADPVSPVGLATTDVYHDPLTTSWGQRQSVSVYALNNNRRLQLYFSVDGGPVHRARFRYQLGEFYNQKRGRYYSRFHGIIRGQKPGSEVSYWIKSGREQLGPYHYTVENISKNPVLIVAAEDYPGRFPDYSEYADNTQPNYLHYYTDALDALGIGYDVWDVDARGTAPPTQEVLSHYDVVIWYSGDDFAPDTLPGFQIHEDEYLAIRDYLNDYDGKIFVTGQALSWISSVFGFGDLSDDFFQYYLGAFTHVDYGGIDSATGLPFSVVGEENDPVFGGLSFALSGGSGANNQLQSASFLPTSQFLPHFDTTLAARYERPGSPFSPYSGNYYMYSQQLDIAYKRLGQRFTVPEDNPILSFRASYDIESDWDYAFVEVAPADTDNWTTLPDINGHTTTDTGDSCASGWVDQLHPQLEHYMDTDCNPSGTTGTWNALTGNSGGWQEIKIDLSAYAGQSIDLNIAYVTDWATQGLGLFIDTIQVGSATVQSFESGLGEWQISTTEGALIANNWERLSGAGFVEGPAIRTPYSVYLGFGFEAIDTAANRTEVMRRVLRYLGIKR